MSSLILQSNTPHPESFETRSLKTYAITHDIPFVIAKFEDLHHHAIRQQLLSGNVPVGSVEFIQRCFEIKGLTVKAINPYPPGLPYGRLIFKRPLYEILGHHIPEQGLFIKPFKLKRFNGFVFRGFNYQHYDEHDKEQISNLLDMRLNDWVYTSEVVNFLAEWRMYYCNGELLGTARYDANDEEYDDPVITIPIKGTRAIDVGLLDNGSYVVVEVNDAWAIGLYKGLPIEKYYQFLITRWREICANLN